MYTYFNTFFSIAELPKCRVAKLHSQAFGNSLTQFWMRRSTWKSAILLFQNGSRTEYFTLSHFRGYIDFNFWIVPICSIETHWADGLSSGAHATFYFCRDFDLDCLFIYWSEPIPRLPGSVTPLEPLKRRRWTQSFTPWEMHLCIKIHSLYSVLLNVISVRPLLPQALRPSGVLSRNTDSLLRSQLNICIRFRTRDVR